MEEGHIIFNFDDGTNAEGIIYFKSTFTNIFKGRAHHNKVKK
jgi:hypothetical protein